MQHTVFSMFTSLIDIRNGITIYKCSIGKVYIRSEIMFTTPQTRRRKSKFPTVSPTMYLQNENCE